MKEKKRCSTLFHLLVPGGKWQTVSVSPVWSAKPCNSHFHSRSRHPLLPLASAVISSRRVRGYRRWPSARHQPQIEATANAPVSWSVPTLTKPTDRKSTRLNSSHLVISYA